MALVLTSPTDYLLAPSLQELHKKTLEWDSCIGLWRQELAFFKKLINGYGTKLSHRENVKEREHLALLLDFYAGGLMDELTAKISEHEAHLATLVQASTRQNENHYRIEHRALEKRFSAFDEEFQCYKHELYSLIEKVMIDKKNPKDELS